VTTLQELVDHRPFGLTVREHGAGTTVAVEWVTITELVDMQPWLGGGELVLTTGVRLVDDADQERFVTSLVAAGAVAVGFGTGLGHEKVPEALLGAARRLDLPVLEVPFETPFVAITRWISDQVVHASTRSLSALVTMYDRLTAHLLAGEGLTAFCEELCQHTGGSVAVIDQQANVLATAPAGSQWPTQALTRLHALTQPTELAVPSGDGERVVVHPIVTDGRTFGVLATRGADRNDALLPFAVRVVGLEIRRRHAVQHGRREQVGQVLEDVVRAAIGHSDAERRLTGFGVDVRAGHRVMLGSVDADPGVLSSLPWPLLGPDVDTEGRVVSAEVEEYLALVFESEEATKRSAPAVLQALQRIGPRASIGIGGFYSGVTGLRWSFFEARDALARGPGIHFGDPLSLVRLLTTNPELPIRELGKATLGRLIEQDGELNGPLMLTLRTYLELNGSVARTADRLFIHRNTVRYRLSQIEQLTGRSLDQTNDRVHLWLALLALGYTAD
jgi:purine catabolism regulator